MKTIPGILLCGMLVLTLLVSACQSFPPVSINDLPAFPGAVAFESGGTNEEAEVAAALKQDMTFRTSAGIANQVSHKTFHYSAASGGNGQDAFSSALKAANWTTRWGWVPAEQIYDRGSQTLIVHWFKGILLMTLNNDPTPPTTATFGKDFQLKLGQTATLDDGLTVTFESVPTDGRCSSCTASFYAAMNLRLTRPGQAPALIRIQTPPLAAIEGDTAPYLLHYVALTPQHNTPNDALNPAAYVLTLSISK